jgi:hypothetical protein
MHNSSTYDGNQVVIHTLKKGDTLSSIAQRYRFKSWTPIWIYNTKVRPVLKGSPDNVPAGTNIFIPRSEQGYDRLMKKFEALEEQMRGFGDQETYSLEGDYYKLQAFVVALDAVGDALTTLATLGLQARKAAELLSAAEKVSGAERIAAEYLAKKQSEELAKAVYKTGIEKGLDAIQDKASSKLPEKYQEKSEYAYKGTVKTAPKLAKAVRYFSLQGGKAFLDVSEMILDYLKPSTVANLWMVHVKGIGTPESAYKKNVDQIAHAVADSCTKLHEKKLRMQKERDLIYGSKANAA